jgi:3-deoxy-D-manno-octulosonic-acid transferase
MRLWIYQLVMWLLWPLWLYYSIKRCRQQKDAWQCWKQLWTIQLPQFQQAPIWIHAVSLGETQAAFILIKQLRQLYPEQPIFFTGGNSSAIQAARQKAIDKVSISFLPLDYAWLRRRLMNAIKPKLLILMETEFWPNLLTTAHQRNLPVAIIQARLSQSSRKNYPKYGQPLLRQLLSPVAFVAAQTQADAQALINLGIYPEHCHLLGNVKYDFDLSPSLTQQGQALKNRLGERWIWTAGSIHAGEELPLLQAHQQLVTTGAHPLLILVPRHPSYFKALADQLDKMDIYFKRWSTWYQTSEALETSVEVLLVDTLGQLMPCYQVAQACFVGGSLVPWGGHNLLEPAALAKPILTGPYNHNFSEIEQGLISAKGMIRTHNKNELALNLIQLYKHPSQGKTMGLNAQHYFQQQQGATQKIIAKLKKYIAN